MGSGPRPQYATQGVNCQSPGLQSDFAQGQASDALLAGPAGELCLVRNEVDTGRMVGKIVSAAGGAS